MPQDNPVQGALTADCVRNWELGNIVEYPIDANVCIFQGSPVIVLDSGYERLSGVLGRGERGLRRGDRRGEYDERGATDARVYASHGRCLLIGFLVVSAAAVETAAGAGVSLR